MLNEIYPKIKTLKITTMEIQFNLVYEYYIKFSNGIPMVIINISSFS